MTPRNNCSINNGKKICIPPWRGDNCEIKCARINDSSKGYSCEKSTPKKICPAGWYGKECDQRTLVVTSASGNTSSTFTEDKIISPTSSLPHHISPEWKRHNVSEMPSLETFITHQTGAPVDLGNQTGKRGSLPRTSKSTLMETVRILSANKPCSVSQDPEISTHKPGSDKARKKEDIWWVVFLPLMAVFAVIVTALVVFRKKLRYVRSKAIGRFHQRVLPIITFITDFVESFIRSW